MSIQSSNVKVTQKQGGTLSAASNQWRERPADQRFETLSDLLAGTKQHMMSCRTGTAKINALTVECDLPGNLYVRGAEGNRAIPNHWAFGQLCQRAKAPAGYLRQLPTELAKNCLNQGLKSAEDDGEARLLVRTGDQLELLAITSEKYKRVWNHEVATALVELQSRQPQWQFPEPFRTAGGRKQATWGEHTEGKQVSVAFASDHDMFVFLCDYERGIQLPNGDTLARGFFVENSEVGDAAFKITMFLFDFVCSNILVWGAKNVVEVKVNHVGRIRDRVLERNSEVLRALSAYSQSSAGDQLAQIKSAQSTLIGKDAGEVLSTLFGRKSLALAKGDIQAAQVVAANTPRYGDPRSVWAMANGLTEVSQRSGHADARIKLDRAAGQLMQDFAF
jgi:hypothetical protein